MGFFVKCVLCPECGVWVVVREATTMRDDSQPESVAPKYLVTCPNPECQSHPQLRVEEKDMAAFKLGPHVFERKYFAPSDVTRWEQG